MSSTRYTPDNDHRLALPASSSGSAHRAIDNGGTSSAIDTSEQPNHWAINPHGYPTDAIPHHSAVNNVSNNGASAYAFTAPVPPTNNGFVPAYGPHAAPTLHHPSFYGYNNQGLNGFHEYERNGLGQGAAEENARILFYGPHQANPYFPNSNRDIDYPLPAPYSATFLPSDDDFSPTDRYDTFGASIATSQANVTDNRNVTALEPSSATPRVSRPRTHYPRENGHGVPFPSHISDLFVNNGGSRSATIYGSTFPGQLASHPPARRNPINPVQYPPPLNNGWSPNIASSTFSEQMDDRAQHVYSPTPRGYPTNAVSYHLPLNNGAAADEFIPPSLPASNFDPYPFLSGHHAAPTSQYADNNVHNPNAPYEYPSDAFGQSAAEQDARVLFDGPNQMSPHFRNPVIAYPSRVPYHDTSSLQLPWSNGHNSASIATTQTNVTARPSSARRVVPTQTSASPSPSTLPTADTPVATSSTAPKEPNKKRAKRTATHNPAPVPNRAVFDSNRGLVQTVLRGGPRKSKAKAQSGENAEASSSKSGRNSEASTSKSGGNAEASSSKKTNKRKRNGKDEGQQEEHRPPPPPPQAKGKGKAREDLTTALQGPSTVPVSTVASVSTSGSTDDYSVAGPSSAVPYAPPPPHDQAWGPPEDELDDFFDFAGYSRDHGSDDSGALPTANASTSGEATKDNESDTATAENNAPRSEADVNGTEIVTKPLSRGASQSSLRRQSLTNLNI